MNYEKTYELLGNVDIYVIDQILKGLYQPGQRILDAGCGSGRNLKWFYKNNFHITGIDTDVNRIAQAKESYPSIAENLMVGTLDELPYVTNSFDHIICCAVLHFATDATQFLKMIDELSRVLKPRGSLLIRMVSDIGLDGKKPFVKDGVNQEIGHFYLTRALISKLLRDYPWELLEPIKTTNVQDIRAMTTLVFQKR